MNLTVPTHYDPDQAKLVGDLIEVLVDALIDFHTAFCRHYADALEPTPDEVWACLDLDR